MAPPRKKQRVAEEALQPEEPLQSVWDLLDDNVTKPAIKSIGFVSCPENMRLDTKEDLKKLEDAVQNLIDLGSEFISVTCAKKGVDMSKILQDLKPLIDKTHMRGARRAQGHTTLCTDTSVSFWSNSFGTGFGTSNWIRVAMNDGKIAIKATASPELPQRAQVRLLEAYVANTDNDTQIMVVYGSMRCDVVGAENLSTRIDTPMTSHVNGTLSLFVPKSNPPNVKLYDIETEGPYSVIADLISSAERPATNTIEPEEPLVQREKPVVLQEPVVPSPRGHRASCCIICEDRCIDVLCQPCGHLVLCRPCRDRVQLHDNRCPTCRRPLRELQRVYGR